MCGIAGWFSRAGRVEAGVLDAVRERMAHRGPDGAGTWVSQDRRVGLAHRRLSIVDPSEAAAQPMHAGHSGNRTSLVLNGEIYNHRALRAELERRGVSFRTDHSDTEVLLRGYLEWGLDGLLERLVGMFAFALCDLARGRAWLVRDRAGEKPLYLAQLDGDVLFASEAKALFAHPRLSPELDHESFRHFLTFRAVAAPRTLFRGVECLGAGELLAVDLASGRCERRTWWDPLERAAAPPASPAAARDGLAELLADSVRLRLGADVPVGLFLSGGLDSAFLLDGMTREGRPVDTFTVGYPGAPGYDEGAQAAERARLAGARHHEVAVDEQRFAGALARAAYHMDEPGAAPVCAPIYLLAQAARAAGVPVVLAGEGSDELFIGYRSWLGLRDAERWNRRLPDVPGRLLRRGADLAAALCLPWTSPRSELLRRAARGQPLFWGGGLDFGERARRRLLGPAVEAGAGAPSTYEAVVEPLRAAFLRHGDPADVTLWMTYVDLRFRLPQLMLPRLDKLAMAWAVESRAPFLDHRVVELVCGLPRAWRGGLGSVPKQLFRSVAEGRLPQALVHGKKRGFRAPVAEWRAGALGPRYLPALRAFARRTGLFDEAAVEDLARRPGQRLWFSLTGFMLWYSIHVEDVLQDRLPEVAELRGGERAAA